MAKKVKPAHKKGCKCPECGKPERVRKLGKTIHTNLCHLLGGICGDCLMKGAS